MMSFGLGLLALVRPIIFKVSQEVASNPGHMLECSPLEYILLGVHWNIGGRPLRSPPQFTYMGWPPLSSDREAGETG